MSQPLFRVRIVGPKAKFQAQVVAPGQLMLDRWNAVDKPLVAWLGRFVAKPEWHNDSFRFWVRNDQGTQLAGVACQPATAADLRGLLKKEFAALQDKLKQAKPASVTEKALYDFVTKGLVSREAGVEFTALNCQFFKYRDVHGQQRLVWCYGYEPNIKRGDAAPLICPLPDCGALQMRHPGLEPKCLECDQPFPVAAPRRRSRKPLVAALLLFLAICGAGAYAAIYPWASVTGRIVRQGDGSPIANAVVHVDGYLQQTQTDAEGKFTLPSLHWGKRQVIAKAPGYQDAQKEVELPFYGENSVELPLAGAAKLSGRIVYRLGEKQVPILSAQVSLAGSDQPVSTDSEGRFQFADLMPGATSLKARAAGFRDLETPAEASADGGEELVIVLSGARHVSGQVVYAADSKTPIAQAEISPIGFEGNHVRTDAEGKFQFDGLPPVEAQLKVVAAGFRGRAVTIKPTDKAVTAELAGDAKLTGEVLRADTKMPVANAEVQLPGTPFNAKTDEKGMYQFEGVRSGPARVTAQSPGLAGAVTQDLAANQTTAVNILLSGSLTATGRVIDATTQEPVVGASVAVADTKISIRTDSQGRYSLPGLAEGATRLAITATGFLSASADIEPSPEKTQVDDVVLQRAASLEARVLSGKDGKPVPNAEVVFGGDGPKTTTNAEGKFRLTPLPTGVGEIVISAADHFPLKVSPKLLAGEQTVDDLTLPVLARARGRVLRAIDKLPLKGATVAIKEGGEKVTTADDGAFEIPLAPAGDVSMAAAAAGYKPERWLQKLVPGDQKLNDILLKGNTPVEGMTLNGAAAKEWVTGAKLEVTAGAFKRSFTSNDKGAFVVGDLPPGTVEVKASAPGFMDAKVIKDVKPGDASIEIKLVPLVDATGVVTSAAGKQPVDKAAIEVTSAAGEHTAVTGKDGAFKLPGVAAGPITVRIKATGFVDAQLDLQLSPKSSRLEIPLQPLLTVQGTVVDAEKKQPIANAVLNLTAGDVSETVKADAKGKFTARLPAGKVSGIAEAAGYCETPIEAILTSANAKLDVRMPAGRALSGTIINAVNNQPVAGASVEVPGSGGKKLMAVSDGSGAFELKSVPAAATSASIGAGGFEPLQLPVPAGAKVLRIVLSPELLPGEVRLVLTWGDRPRDMDSHLYGPLVDGKPLHVSFKNRMGKGATLDVDGKEGFGPETITINNPGKYEYFVAHPENLDTKDGEGLAKSAAEVRVYYKGGKGEVFRVPSKATGPLWHVLDVAVDPAGKVTIAPKKDVFYSKLRGE